MYVFALLIISILSCKGGPVSKDISKQASTSDSKNISQFRNVATSGADSLWVITVNGKLLQLSKKSGQYSVTAISAPSVISFANSEKGWVVDRNNTTWSTHDGGRSWKQLQTPEAERVNFYLPQQLTFVDDLNGWLIGLFKVWRTGDGGKRWQECFSVEASKQEELGRIYRGAFLSPELGWFVSSGGIVAKTTDGGKNWGLLLTLPGKDIHDVFFSNTSRGWLVSRPTGGIYSTEDSGANWSAQFITTEQTYLNSVQFLDENAGWAAGWRSIADSNEKRQGIVLRTLDGGKSWSPLSIGFTEPFFDRVIFFDNKHGWLIGRDSIYYTEDGGQSWLMIFQLPQPTSM